MAKDLLPFMLRFTAGIGLALSLDLSQDYPFLAIPLLGLAFYLLYRWGLALIALKAAQQGTDDQGQLLAQALNEAWLCAGWVGVYLVALVVWRFANNGF